MANGLWNGRPVEEMEMSHLLNAQRTAKTWIAKLKQDIEDMPVWQTRAIETTERRKSDLEESLAAVERELKCRDHSDLDEIEAAEL